MNPMSASIVAAGLTAALLTGCSAPASRTGSTSDPVTLRPATAGGPGVGNDVLDALAAVTIKGTVHVADPGFADQMTPGADRTLDLLAEGSADIGVVRSGVLVTAGATSLRGLQAPFVITNNEQAAAVAADPIAETAMADLAKIHLVGLALVPGGLRHPFGYGAKPIVRATDFQGAVINTREDDAGVSAIMAALGATQDHSIAAERTTKAKDGRLRGIEVSLQQFGAVDRPAMVTTNVTLYATFDVVVVRKTLWSSLSSTQRAELRSAAHAVRVSAPAARGSEQKAFADWCAGAGAGAAKAADADLKSLHDALEPVTAALESDPRAKKVIARMRTLHAGTTEEPSDLTCATREPSASPWQNLDPVGDQTVLDGTWRFTPTEADLLAGGLTASDAHNNAAGWQVTLKNGEGTATGGGGHTCLWRFTFAGTRVLFDFTQGESCGGMAAGTYRRAGDVVTFVWTEPANDDYGLNLYNGIFGRAVRVTG